MPTEIAAEYYYPGTKDGIQEVTRAVASVALVMAHDTWASSVGLVDEKRWHRRSPHGLASSFSCRC